MLKVAKFGGSSSASGEQLKKVADIIKSDLDKKYIVVSAPGKRFGEDNKITDLLYLCHAHITYSVPFDQVYKMIVDRYSEIVKDLGIEFDLDGELNEIKEKLGKNISVDYLVSRGEYLNAKILAKYLGYKFVDAKDIVFFKMDGTLDEEKTSVVMRKVLNQAGNAVIPGFYGTGALGDIKTFSRGGSDITGAIVSMVMDADVYENWTDVSGFMMADPRIIDNPKRIRSITYRELRELSYMGAKVLHDEAIYPVRNANIPINIKNTNNPEDPGTMIINEREKLDTDLPITGIAGRKDFTVIGLQKFYMNSEVGFVRKLLSTLEMFDITFEHIPSGIDTVSIVIDNENLNGKLEKLLSEIERVCKPDALNVYKNIALLAVVGQNMAFTTGVSAKIFNSLGENDINIRMIDQGSSEMNIIVGVAEKDFEKAIKSIYAAFNK
ncbi:aspartate kinase [Dethiosulfatibacter aminovorans DSM 17477]|uniref:Aspartokinase n=1 Tax=Dethiosulfatibacter aminovorans DSM 17477 TaxID=1121476 RepID=A0A1M6DNV1_9FIRM|nr:aspartate kinase [Dethiosulfatibacter aminovorans]SHI74843.1 aspartate kinase [Dethiosulfatibacter aminovorans DSM 17477]